MELLKFKKRGALVRIVRIEEQVCNLRILGIHIVLLAEFGGKGDR